MCPMGCWQIQTSVHAGGMARALMRSRVARSVMRSPSQPTYMNPLPARRRTIPGDEQSTRFRRGTSAFGDERAAAHEWGEGEAERRAVRHPGAVERGGEALLRLHDGAG